MLVVADIAEKPRKPISPAAALASLQSHQEAFSTWLCGPAPWRPGDVVTVRANTTIDLHGCIMIVIEVDRTPIRVRPDGTIPRAEETTPPPRDVASGLRSDVRAAFLDSDGDIRQAWFEGWMLEPWSLEKAEQYRTLQEAERGKAQ